MPHFAMRRFTMGEGGGMPLHTNRVEHEQYVLAGRARVPDVQVVAAHGLTLEEVGYPGDAELAERALSARRLRSLPHQDRYDEPQGGLAQRGDARG